MRKTNLLLLSIVMLFCAYNVFAQYQDGTVPGPNADVKSAVTTENHTIYQEAAQRVNNGNTNPANTDEYGSYNYNAVCVTGTGGGYVAAPGVFEENVDGSLEAWVYPTATTSSAPLIVSKSDAGTGFLFGWQASTTLLYFRIGGSPTVNTGGTVVPLNTWSHVAVTWTGSSGNYTLTFYVNGAISGAPVNNAGTWTVNSDSLIIGSSRATFGGKDFIGNIDEVRYWTDVRTAAEIRDNRFVGLGDGAGANTSGALTSSAQYAGLNNSWTFNSGGNAYDDIGGCTGYYRKGAGPYYASPGSNPIPYNLALHLFGGANDYVTVPTNSAFNQTSAGSIDAWIKLSAVGVLQTICSKGTAFATHNFAFYITSGNKIGLNIGAHNYMSTGVTFVTNQWYHVAATWTGGPNFTVNLYVNGVLDYTGTFNLAMPTNSDPFIIGKYYSASGYFNGYIDELRIWGNALTPAQITKYMFVSSRSASLPATCVGAWNFDGNLNNFAATTGINGSFSTGGTNNGCLSGYANETTIIGPPANTLIAHPTVLNRTGATNPFPDGFALKLSNKPIPDNTTITDTIKFASSRTITSVELFLAIQHTYVNDLTITLKAPNGTSRSVIASTGGTGEGILTFFADGNTLPSTAGFFAPWSYIAAPAVTFGNFGSANMLGNWVLTIADGASGDPGVLQAWGLRFNGDVVTGVTPVANEVPKKFEIFQNYPNPFNPVTTIKYNIPVNSSVKIKVYDILGKEINTLVNEHQNAGTYKVDFDGSMLASGVYFYKIEAGQFTEVKKMNLIK